jgi:hypothetical protein
MPTFFGVFSCVPSSALKVLDTSLADAPPYLWNLLLIPEEPDPLAQMDAQIKRQCTLEWSGTP